MIEGNGNHCDFIAGELRAAKLTQAQISTFYDASPEVLQEFDVRDPIRADSPKTKLQALAGTLPGDSTELCYIELLARTSEAGFDLRSH